MGQKNEKLRRQVEALRKDVAQLGEAQRATERLYAALLDTVSRNNADRITAERRAVRRARQEAHRQRLNACLALILAAMVCCVALIVTARADAPETPLPEAAEAPTRRELLLDAALAAADVDQPAQEQVRTVWTYYNVPLSTALQDDLRCACDESGVEMALALAVIRQETEYRNLVGDGGRSVGYMQVQPRWHGDRMARLGAEDLTVPLDNFRVGCDYLAELMARYPLTEALTAYNTGAPGKSEYAISVIKYAEEIRSEEYVGNGH